MNRRQRKKLRIGEFRELGFHLAFRTPEGWSDPEQGVFWDQCVGVVESLGLAVAGSAGTEWDVFVTGLRRRATVTLDQRQALLDWLAAHPGVTDVRASGLEDAWHPATTAGDAPGR